MMDTSTLSQNRDRVPHANSSSAADRGVPAADTQFGGNLPPLTPQTSGKPDFFAALQEQLGLKMESARAPIDTIMIDSVQKPSEN
jgi:uncharacterized protein (TIGR03435 family)